MTTDTRNWVALVHASALVGLLGNGIGFVLGPLVVWLLKRNDSPAINEAGKEAINFQLTMLGAAILCFPLLFMFIGIPLLLLVVILATVLPLMAASRALNGQPFRYPLSIRLLK